MRKGLEEDCLTINAGKNGMTKNLINEINFQLEKRGKVKVRMLRSFRNKDKNELAVELSGKIDGRLVNVKGFVITFERC